MLPGTLSMESSAPARVSLSRERGDYAVTPLAIAMDDRQACRARRRRLRLLREAGAMERRAEDCVFVVAGEAYRRSGAVAVGQRVRHSLRRGGRPL